MAFLKTKISPKIFLDADISGVCFFFFLKVRVEKPTILCFSDVLARAAEATKIFCDKQEVGS